MIDDLRVFDHRDRNPGDLEIGQISLQEAVQLIGVHGFGIEEDAFGADQARPGDWDGMEDVSFRELVGLDLDFDARLDIDPEFRRIDGMDRVWPRGNDRGLVGARRIDERPTP